MDIRVGMFRKAEDDSLEMLSEVGYEYYGVCPAIGDVIVWAYGGSSAFSYYQVTERFFMDDRTFLGWAIIVSKLEPTKLHFEVSTEWEISKETNRQIAEEESGPPRPALYDQISRAKEGDRAKYPRLYPAAEDYPSHREPTPRGLRSPIEPPLERWEKKPLNDLLQYKVGMRVPASAVAELGPSSMKALAARGYIGTEIEGTKRSKRTVVWLTQEAANDVAADIEFQTKYFPTGD